MSATATQIVNVAEALKGRLDGVDGLRAYWYAADTARPPLAVVGQPTIDYRDASGGFCQAVWLFTIELVVARNDDRAAQTTMSRLLSDAVMALTNDVDDGIVVEPQDARPATITLAGQDLPGYLLTVKVRA